MVNDVAYNDIVHSVSIMTLSIFCEKLIQSKLGGLYSVIYLLQTFVEFDYFLWVKTTTK